MVALIIILFFIGIFGVYGCAADGNTIQALLLGVILIAPVYLLARHILNKKPSTMICTNCGSGDVRITSRVEGTAGTSSAQFKRSYIAPHHRAKIDRQTGTKIDRQRVAVCQTCGFDYPYFTEEEIRREQRGAKGAVIAMAILVLLLFGMGCLSNTPEFKAAQEKAAAESNTIWSADYTPLSDFDYYIDGSEIVLKSYKGRSQKVRIAPSYDMDGETMRVVALDGVFALKTIKSAIIPEGVTRIADNAFNSCGVKNLYLPASLDNFSGWSYFHDMEKLYYGGTEEQWNTLCTYDRSRLEVVRIMFNTNLDDLLTK